tara:strand:- start:149767 stop:151119 length:1353 start_codon:yes stop_codon:yes gene_type:complete
MNIRSTILPVKPLATMLLCSFLTIPAMAQNSAHPDAKSPLVENPYIKHTDPWRYDIRSQLFLRWGDRYVRGNRTGIQEDSYDEHLETVSWPIDDLEIIFPVVREGAFYWSPNRSVDASIRADDFTQHPDPKQLYTKGTNAEYSDWQWTSEIEDQLITQFHIIQTTRIVVADTVFDEKKARLLAWPEGWDEQASSFLTPIVDSVGQEVAPDADESIATIVSFWLEENDPKSISQLDLVKYITGKVIEHVEVRSPPAELPKRSGFRNSRAYNGADPVMFSTSSNWAGFVVRPADEVARDPKGTKHDLATLLCAALRSVGVPARTLLCVNDQDQDILESFVSMVEFAMYDPDLELTFWVPIDVDKLRLNGKRSSQYKQWWNYFGTHDELSHYIPVAYYFHPPASYRAYDLPALYGLRSSSPMPKYAVQSLLIDPMVSTVTAPKPKKEEGQPPF